MANPDDDFMNAVPLPAEVKACARIIFDYHEGRLTLEEAAPRLQVALRANPYPLNLGMSPRIRQLFAEVARLEGRPVPNLGPDPHRHVSGGRELFKDLKTEAWSAIERLPGEPRSLVSFFSAATEATARALVTWLGEHGHDRVTIESPAEADADDWFVCAHTQTISWTKEAVEAWAESIRRAPLGDDSSFTGWGA